MIADHSLSESDWTSRMVPVGELPGTLEWAESAACWLRAFCRLRLNELPSSF